MKEQPTITQNAGCQISTKEKPKIAPIPNRNMATIMAMAPSDTAHTQDEPFEVVDTSWEHSSDAT